MKTESYLFLTLFLFISGIFCKDLHVKEGEVLKEILVVNTNNNNAYLEHERFIRHVETTATESIIHHLVNQLRKRYPQLKHRKTMNKMMKNLKLRLKDYVHKKKPIHKKPLPKKIHKITWKKSIQ